MGFRDPCGELSRHVQAPGKFQFAGVPEQAAKAFALHILHRKVNHVPVPVKLVQPRHVTVGDQVRQAQLVLESFEVGKSAAISGFRILSASTSPVSRSRTL